MSTTQAHVQTSIRRATAPIAKPKIKSAGAQRMARTRSDRKMLEDTARLYHGAFVEGTFRKLAESCPKGSTISARSWQLDAWLKAANIPEDARKALIATVIGR